VAILIVVAFIFAKGIGIGGYDYRIGIILEKYFRVLIRGPGTTDS
jgi:hypothetical protein